MPEEIAGALEASEPWMDFYIAAYRELCTCRAPGFAKMGPIPWTAIDRYAERYGLDDDDFASLVRVVRAVEVEDYKEAE